MRAFAGGLSPGIVTNHYFLRAYKINLKEVLKMTLFGCDNPLNIASTNYVDCVVTTISGFLWKKIPGIVYTDFSQVVVSGTTTRTNVLSYTIPANTIIPGEHAMKITSSYTTSQGTASNPQYAYFIGSLNNTDSIYVQPNVDQGNLNIKVENVIYPKSTASQKILSEGTCSSWVGNLSNAYEYGSIVIDDRDTAVDATQNISFKLDLTLSAANAAFYVIRDSVIVELI